MQANENRPLVPLTTEQQEKLSGKQGIFLIQEQINVEMERYALLRQDLERVCKFTVIHYISFYDRHGYT